MTEKDKFVDRFRAELAAGMQDLKFFVREGVSMTEEEFTQEANRFAEAAKDSEPVNLAELDAELKHA